MFEIAGGIILAAVILCNFEAVFKFAYYAIAIGFFGFLLILGLDTFFRQTGEDQITFLCICAVVALLFYFHIKRENRKTAKELAKIHAEAVDYHQR
jgi:phosphotransferase system  glucose/maltose/N-acetylglucosamine-specific IIC component